MRTGLLRGREHMLLGAVATLAERRVAIALSRGGAAKTYGHRDPNEDACAFAWTEHAWLVAVADGHWGSGGAELALDRLLERHAPRWTSPSPIALADRWSLEAPDVVLDLNHALLAAGDAQRHDRAARRSRSASCARATAGGRRCSIGDSHLFAVDGATARECVAAPCPTRSCSSAIRASTARRSSAACAAPSSRERRARSCSPRTDSPKPESASPTPRARSRTASRAAREQSADLRPLAAARGLAERALEAQRRNVAGDNVATACIWLGGLDQNPPPNASA